MRAILSAVFLCGGIGSAAFGAPCPIRPSWPTQTWPSAPVDPVAKNSELAALEAFAFTLEGKDEERLGYRTNALLVVKGGAVVYERYGRGFDETHRHLSWSVGKSISSALIGMGIHQGALTLDDSLCLHLEKVPQDRCSIRVRDVLTFSSGLQWQEQYENAGYQASSVISMLFGAGHRDQIRHVLTHKVVAAPGTRFVYSTGDAHVLATVAKRALEKKLGEGAFWTALFDKVGMSHVSFEEDSQRSALGGSFVYARARDFARFGYFYLNDGCWSGERILPEGYVAASTTVSDAFKADRADGERTPNGYMWWLNRALPEAELGKPWPDAPDDTFAALGHWGQYVIVIPSEDVVIVRTGDDRQETLPINGLIQHVLAVVR
jgi:CubicO group peptidase (beta-lactamase class C family)